MGQFIQRKGGDCRGQYFNTLKDNYLVRHVIAWSDKRTC